jgi:hypothetical protein
MGKSMWFVSPSPVRHIAEHSAIGHGGNTGKRNCGNCADLSRRLTDQIPEFNHLHRYDAGTKRVSKLGFNKPSFWVPKSLWEAIRKTVKRGMTTLEYGVGVSTTAFEGANHTAIESDKDLTAKYRCAQHSEVVDGWYTLKPERQFDVILVDGPYKGNRYRFIEHVKDLVKPTTIIFIDDTHREVEKNLANDLATLLNKTVEFVDDPDPEYKRQWAVLK